MAQKVTVQPDYRRPYDDYTIPDVEDVSVGHGGVLLVKREDATVIVRDYAAATVEPESTTADVLGVEA